MSTTVPNLKGLFLFVFCIGCDKLRYDNDRNKDNENNRNDICRAVENFVWGMMNGGGGERVKRFRVEGLGFRGGMAQSAGRKSQESRAKSQEPRRGISNIE